MGIVSFLHMRLQMRVASGDRWKEANEGGSQTLTTEGTPEGLS